MTALRAERLSSRVHRADGPPVIRSVDLEAQAGSITAVIGPSGAGKSSLLDLVTGIDVPRSGTVRVGATRVHPARSGRRALLRARTIATARQTDDLIDALSVDENILLGQRLARRVDRTLRTTTLRAVGLPEPMHGLSVGRLSGGERHRVAIARALSSGSPFIVADEPTSALDAQSAHDVRALLRRAAELGHTVLVATHDPALAAMADRVVLLVDGAVVVTLDRPSPEQVHTLMKASK